jgi:adenosyl cobinamide kinase/adenosyl cobinamide phosphate guanylyltransferase
VITLVLGGARSGKSEIGEQRAFATATGGKPASGPGEAMEVLYVATGVADPADPDWSERIERHRSRRPVGWHTLELPLGGDLVGALGAPGPDVVLVDSLATWLAGCADFAPDVDGLLGALRRRSEAGLATIIVSDEAGLGVHPSTAAGQSFRDAIGTLNRRVADVADEVVLVVAGRALNLPAPDPRAEDRSNP